MKLKILGLMLALTSTGAFPSEAANMKDLLADGYEIVAGWSIASTYGPAEILVLHKNDKAYKCELSDVSYSKCEKIK